MRKRLAGNPKAQFILPRLNREQLVEVMEHHFGAPEARLRSGGRAFLPSSDDLGDGFALLDS